MKTTYVFLFVLTLIGVGCATDSRPRGVLGGYTDGPRRTVEVAGMGIANSTATSQNLIIVNADPEHQVRLFINGMYASTLRANGGQYAQYRVPVPRDRQIALKVEYLKADGSLLGVGLNTVTLRSQDRYSYSYDLPPEITEQVEIPRYQPNR
jgi:hypothetical protein